MKRLITFFLAAAVFCSMRTAAFASEPTEQPPVPSVVILSDEPEASKTAEQDAVLRDVRLINENGQNLLIKTWEVPADFDPEQLTESDIEKGGYRYQKSYLMLVSENTDVDTKLASQTVTVVHSEKDGASARLQPLMEYNQDGYKGQLALQADSIYTEATQKNSYAYTVTDTKEFSGLERNDPYGIPKTTVKNGVTLELADIDWTSMGEGNYYATASYQGTAYGANVTEYTSTATYLGEVTKETIGSVTYAVVYEGSMIPLPAPVYWPYFLAGGLLIAAAIAGAVLWHNRRNAKIYALIDGEYRVVQRIRINYIDPIIDLTAPSLGPVSREYLILIDPFAAKRLNNHFLRVLCADGTVKEHRLVNNGYGCKFKVGSVQAIDPNDTEEENSDE